GGILFGIHELKKKEDKPATKDPDKAEPKKDPPGKADDDEPAQRTPPAARPGAAAEDNKDRPDLVIWHYQDERLQSQQQVQAAQDKSFSYLCVYRVKDRKFHRLADETLRQVTAAPKQRWAIGLDERTYQLMGTLDGRRYQDVHVVDLETGQRRLAL